MINTQTKLDFWVLSDSLGVKKLSHTILVDSIIHTLDFALPIGEDPKNYKIKFGDINVQGQTVDICSIFNICPNWNGTNKPDGLFESQGLDIALKNKIDLKKIGGNR